MTVNNDAPTDSTFTGANGSENTSMVKVWVTGHPTSGFFNRIHFGRASLGWKEGLTIATEDCTGDCTGADRKRWTWNEWEQDIVGGVPYTYVVNPRISETRVGDGTNTKRTEIFYHQASIGEGDNVAKYGLVGEVRVYDTDLSTVLKKTVTTYSLGSLFVNRRIIGLPSQIDQYGGTTLVSKVTFAYDEGGYTATEQGFSTAPVQRDNFNYSSSLSTRGNLTSTTRWDAEYPTDNDKKVTTSTVYNIAGSPVSTKDARNRETTISYTDNFNSSGNPTTYAYPKTITDPGGFSSEIKYRYDIGANVWARSPKPEGSNNQYGKTTERIYDSKGRIERENILNSISQAYTRYEYANTGNAMTSFTTVTDGGDSVGQADEVLTLTEFDGAGRVIKTRTENPNAPSGAYTGKLFQYDILGRLTGETAPAEINSSWTPVGDDSAGWLWNSKQYDWKDRVTRIIPTDSNMNGDQDTIMEYTGCGCAGGQETTILGPLVPRDDTTGTARRKQRITEDILGRAKKAEIFEWNGSTVYSTTTTLYNGRDQATSIKQYVGTNGTMQETTMQYDGHGRLFKKHLPQWFDSQGARYTTTTYNKDDTVATVTDPRDAVATYKYGNLDNHTVGDEDRALLTRIEYSAPSPIPTPVPVEFIYDDAGNRTKMTDGTGVLDYEYDELSRLKTESKNFADTLPNEISGGVYTLTYNYHLTGGIKSITDPFNNEVYYTADKVGRTTAIGSSGNGSTQYASGIQHRAFGSLKEMTLSATKPIEIDLTYDNALRPSSYVVTSDANQTDIHNTSYTYNNDGMVGTIVNDLEDNIFNQLNKFDFAGRLTTNSVGSGGISPFVQTIEYDAFGNMKKRRTWTWGFAERAFEAGYTNNRKSWAGNGGSTDTFDIAGNVTSSIVYGQNFNSQYHEFDAAGRQWRWEGYGSWGDSTKKGGETTFDGDGRAAKKADLTMIKIQGNWGDWDEEYSYSLYSSVTGQKIVNLRSDGEDLFIYLGGTEIAKQRSEGDIHFKLTDPVSGRERITDPDGVMFVNEEDRIELAGLGTSVPITNTQGGFPNADYENGGWAGNPENGCVDDMGDPMPCTLQAWISDGWGSPDETTPVVPTGINIPPPPRPDEFPEQQPGSPNAFAYSSGGSGSSIAISMPEEEETIRISTVEFNPRWEEYQNAAYQKQTRYTNSNDEIRKAIVDADYILTQNTTCAQFFGEYRLQALAALDKSLRKGNPPGGGPSETSIGAYLGGTTTDVKGETREVGNQTLQTSIYRTFATAVVNQYGPFFNGKSRSLIGGYGPRSRESRVLQILHELAHMIYKPDGTKLIPDDGGSGKEGVSESNTQKILDDAKCRDEIAKLWNKK